MPKKAVEPDINPAQGIEAEAVVTMKKEENRTLHLELNRPISSYGIRIAIGRI